MNSSAVVTISLGRGPDPPAEQAGDQEAEKGQKDDGRIHAVQPFII